MGEGTADRVTAASVAALLHRRSAVLAAAAALGVLVLWAPFLLGYLRHGTGDIAIFRATAGGVFHGNELYDRVPSGVFAGFTNPPATALLLSPLVLLTQTGAYVVVSALNLAALLRVCVLLGRRAADDAGGRLTAWTFTWLLVGIGLLMAPTNSHFRLGHFDLLLVWLVVEDLLGPMPAQRRGYLTGVATALKLTPGFFVLAMLATGRRAQAGRAALAAASITAVGFVVDPAASWRFVSHLGAPVSLGDKRWAHNQSISGPLMRQLGQHVGWLLYLPLAIALGAFVLVLVRRLDRDGRPLLAVGTCALGMLLVSPVSWDYYFVWTLPLLAALLAQSVLRPQLLLLLVPSVAVLASTAMWSVPYGLGRETTWHGMQLVLGNCYLLVSLALLAWVTWEVFGAQRLRASAIRSTARSTA